MPSNIPELIKDCCERFRNRPALAAEGFELTYGDLQRQISLLAGVMKARGIEPGDRVALLATNSPWWGVVYLATMTASAVIVPVLPDFPAADVHHILRETMPKMVFVSASLADRIAELDDSNGAEVVMMSNDKSACPPGWLNLDEIMAEGEEPLPTPEIDGGDDATIIYTSGTSGHSKGVVLSHTNLVSNARAAALVVNIDSPYRFLSLLPLAHAYELTLGFLLPLLTGATIFYPGIMPTPAMLKNICSRFHPHAICMVPLIIEKIFRKRIKPQLEENLAFRLGRYLPPLKTMVIRKAGKKLLQFLGNEIRIFAIGGAALDRETEDFLRDARVPFLCGYGLSEASPLIAAGPRGAKIPPGSVGHPVPGVEVRIKKEDPEQQTGIIMARGPNIFKGYFKKEALTAEVLDSEGWLDTGDLGWLDDDNCLHITGRAKSVIVLANGENIYPEIIEAKLASSPLVAEVLVVVRDNSLEALVHPDYDYIDQHFPGSDQNLIREKLEEMRLKVNHELAASARVKKIRERREPFLKTATQKIKRYLYTEE